MRGAEWIRDREVSGCVSVDCSCLGSPRGCLTHIWYAQWKHMHGDELQIATVGVVYK